MKLVNHRRTPRRAPLAQALALVLGAGACFALPLQGSAATIEVQNCADWGPGGAPIPGSLRAAVQAAASGDTIDLRGLSCASIPLEQDLEVTVDSLRLLGGGAPSPTNPEVWVHAAALDGQLAHHLRHSGTGLLTLSGIEFVHGGHEAPTAGGGCIISAGGVRLEQGDAPGSGSWVHACTVSTLADVVEDSAGGAIMAVGDVTLDGGARVTGSSVTATGVARGGGIYSSQGSVTIRGGAAVSDNMASGFADGGAAAGGGIWAWGPVLVEAGQVHANRALSPQERAQGGGIFGRDGVELVAAVVSDNEAQADATEDAWGGGIAVGGGAWAVAITDSAIRGNRASGTGGGVYATDTDVVILGSSISGNEAGESGSALHARYGVAITGSTIANNTGGGAALHVAPFLASAVTISNSTISGNTAARAGVGAGIYFGSANTSLLIRNSTITGNWGDNENLTKYGVGIAGVPGSHIILSSSVVAGNHRDMDTGASPSDIGAVAGANDADVTVAGDEHNVTGAVTATIDGAIVTDVHAPGLGPLADNGGPTRTHMPCPGSVLIDAGVDNGYTTDQRGPGFPRVIGPAADIGAVESRWTTDSIFYDGFEPASGC